MSALTRLHRRPVLLSTALAAVVLAAGPVLAEGDSLPAPPAHQAAPRSAADTVRVAVLERWPPYYRWPEGGEPDGFAVESFQEIAERAGLIPEFRRFPDFPTAIEALRRAEVDVIPNLGDMPSRRDWASFTSPVQTFPVVVFTRDTGPDLRDLSDLTGRTVGVVRENVGHQLLADRPAVARAVYPAVEQALFGLLAGEVEAVLYPRPVLLALARDIGAEGDLRVSDTPLTEVKRAVAVRPGRAALHARLDSAVTTYVGSPDYGRAYRRWFGQPEPFWTVERVAWTAGGGFLLTIILAAAWRYRTLQRLNRELRERDERFRQLADSIEEVFWLRTVDGSEMLYVSPAYEKIWNRPVEELYRRPGSWLETIHPEDRDRVQNAALEGPDASFEVDYRIVRPDGELRWIHDRGFPVEEPGTASEHAAGVASDITERKRLEERFRYESLHDPLTGLANRTLLSDRVEQGLSRARRHGASLGVLMLDVDQFKRINDRLGHAAGDRVLTEVARRLESALREDDTVARWGGDEFFVVLPEFEGAETMAEIKARIHEALRSPIEAAGESVHVEASIGAVVYGDESQERAVQTEEPAELIRFASLALHWAKEDGRAGFKLFDPDTDVEGAALIQRERALREALEEGQILPHYQPIVRLEDGETVGVEALARWRHPERGLLSPGEFIPLAEELGLIGELGEAIVRQGCQQMARLKKDAPEEADLSIAFNLSGDQFRNPALAEELEGSVVENGLAPEDVTLEVTETALMELPARVEDLRAAGFKVSIDDFGTGYSTFAYLREFDVDALKIDMTFVQGITGSPSDVALIETMLTLGQRLGLQVVAEGIETEEQLQKLRALGCPFGQGYLFARPGPLAEIVSHPRDPDGKHG